MAVLWKAATDKVIVQRIANATTTASGIAIPDSLKGKTSKGIVLAAGPEANGVKVGDTVIYQVAGAVEVERPDIFSMHVDYVAAIQREEADLL